MPLIITQAPVITLNAITGATNSETISLDKGYGAETISVQSNIDVIVPANKTFTSGAKATVTIQNVVYTAVDVGTAGNSITIAYTDGATAGAEVVTVTDTAISVQIESGVSTATQILTAVNEDEDAALLVLATTASGATAQTAPVVETALEDGLDDTVDTDLFQVTIASNLFPLGLKVRLTTTGTLPEGVTTGTDYFVIPVDDSTIAFASTLANAKSGTRIELTDEGTGTHTVAVTALAGATVCIEYSNDGVYFGAADTSDATSPISITSDETVFIKLIKPSYRFARISYTITAGSLNTTNYVVVKSYSN